MDKFLDTNCLLAKYNDLSNENDSFFISSITLTELENIKVSSHKDPEVKYQARCVVRWLDNNQDKYNVVVYTTEIEQYIIDRKLEITPDTKIIACAKYVQENKNLKNFVFVTDDLCCKTIAKSIFKLDVIGIHKHIDEKYTGFVEKPLSDEDMAYFYEHQNENIFGLKVNQYLIIKNLDNDIVDTMRWTGTEYKKLFNKNIKTVYFDKLKAKDIYQSCAIDSLISNSITAISGKAGSGKSLLSLMVAMYLIENGTYDRIVVMFNPTKTRGASDLGYYSGSLIDKAMDNSIGNILTTKFGDRYAVDLLMQQNKLKLISMADCRGMEINDNEILWITECQNTSIDLIKLCLSRVSSGAKIFMEGDFLSQVDSKIFAGDNNGLKRVIDVFQGHQEFGYVQLQNVWRSKIAELCELL